MAAKRIISADSHMMEPGNLWVERVDRKFSETAPRVVVNDKGRHVFVGPGLSPFPVQGGFAAGRSGEELKQFMNQKGGYEMARPSGWDPAERLKDQDVDGVYGEVLYTTLGMPLFALQDQELQRACFRVYNDWVADFCAYNPKRLYGIALISLEDIAEGVKELERARKLGFKGAMISGAPQERAYHLKEYDPFWAAAQELGMPLSLHIITGRARKRTEETKPERRSENALTSGGFVRSYMRLIHEVQRSFTDIVFGGVLMRFPRLKLVSAENDSGWIPHYMYRLDHAFEKWGAQMEEPLDMKPSEYIRRQLWATFQDDPTGPMTWQFFGEKNYMWASDFPHTDSTWPHSMEVIEKDFAGIPEHVKQRIVCDNAAALYQVDLN